MSEFMGLRTAIYHVEDIERAKEWYSRALAISPVGDGILVATVTDPFANALGVIENPHFALP